MTTIIASKASQPQRLPRWLASALFRVPNPTRPGLLAFCVVIARATLGGLLIAVPAALIWGAESAIGGLPRLTVTIGWVVFEELARLNFAYRADRPVRALLLFLILIVATETLFYPTGGYDFAVFLLARSPSIALHLVATAGLAIGFAQRRSLWAMFALVTVVHVTFNYWAPEIVGALTGLDKPQP